MEEKVLTPNEQRSLLIECLDHCIDGSAGVFLTEARFKNDELLNSVEIAKKISTDVRPVMRFGGDWVFVDLEFPARDSLDLKSFSHIWEQFLNKATEVVKNPEAFIDTEFLYTIDIVGTDENTTYIMTVTNPAFFCQMGNKLSFSAPLEHLSFHKAGTDFAKLDEEIEYDYRTETGSWDDLK